MYVCVLWYSVTGVRSAIDEGDDRKKIKTWTLRLGIKLFVSTLTSRRDVSNVAEKHRGYKWKVLAWFPCLQFFSGSFIAFVPNSCNCSCCFCFSRSAFCCFRFHACRRLRGKLELLKIKSCFRLGRHGLIAITCGCVLDDATLVDFRRRLWMAADRPSMTVKDDREIHASELTCVDVERWAVRVRMFS